MRLEETAIHGAFLIHAGRSEDQRGSFSRLWCGEQLAQRGLVSSFVQCNSSYSLHKGTLRGLHYQVSPHEEVKLVRCVKGAIYDVVVDLRPESPTFKRWAGFELRDGDGRSLYVPAGIAHGFLTLSDATEVCYPVSAAYAPGHERGIRWNDPSFAIEWPETDVRHISSKDRNWPDYAR